MDAESSQDRRPGGTVEPANRSAIAKQRIRQPEASATERYELRDPFAEVTYRAKTLGEMVIHAERLGAMRFHFVASDGSRAAVEKVDGAWKRLDEREAHHAEKVKEEPQRSATVVPIGRAPVEPEASVAAMEEEAARAARILRLEAQLGERYVIKRAAVNVTEYRYRGDTGRVAFTESTYKLATDNNSPSVARSMVDVAEARQWQALRVSGHEDFRRMVWLEASLRGVRTLGYEANQADRELLQKERESRQLNRIEPAHGEGAGSHGNGAEKPTGRGGGGRKAVLAALEAVLVAKRVPTRQREAVMSAAAENLATRLREGQIHKVKVYDRSAPAQRPAVTPSREVHRTRERTPPAR